MKLSWVDSRLRSLLGRALRIDKGTRGPNRGSVTHVVILDGTMSKLTPGLETNAGLLFRLLGETVPAPHISVLYEKGIQWQSWRRTHDVIAGVGINRQIRRAYGNLASRYKPGDRSFLFGYSRGAYAVRSLAGVIDRIGLVKAEHATVRNIRLAYRYYERGSESRISEIFRRKYCHSDVEIEMVGVWDTVKALGLRLPLVWRFTRSRHAFHNHELGRSVKNGFHALALHETRQAFEPVLWTCPGGRHGHVEQVWFRGSHGDIGGQLTGKEEARPLANIPMVWMLENAEGCGLPLPTGWRRRFPMDVEAPSVGTFRGWGKLFLIRRKRRPCQDRSERIHPTALSAGTVEAPEAPLQPN